VRDTIKRLLSENGAVGVVVYFAIFFAVLGGFWLAIHLGWRTHSAAGTAGALAAAYVATKLTHPLRIAATLVLTPAVARLYERLRGLPPADPHDPSSDGDATTRSNGDA